MAPRTLFPRSLRQKPLLGTLLDLSHPLSQGLVGAWLLNEGGGALVNDLANRAFGTLTNTPTWESGLIGSEIKMVRASAQFVNVGNPSALQTLDDITILCSYRLDALIGGTTAQELVTKDGAAGNRGYVFEVKETAGQGVRFYINGGAGADLIKESRTPVAGDDRQVAASYRKQDKKIDLYVDSKNVATGTATTSGIPSVTVGVRFGRRGDELSPDNFNGRIRYVYIWNRRLEASEVMALYIEPYAMFAPAPTTRLWWVPSGAAPVFRDAPTRFRLWGRAIKDATARFRLSVAAARDVASRFRLTVAVVRDVAARFVLIGRTYADAQARFTLTSIIARDALARFVLGARAYADAHARFVLVVARDARVRVVLVVRGYADAPLRLVVIARGYANAIVRFIVEARSYRDARARFVVVQSVFRDVAVLLRLVVRGYADSRGRFVIDTDLFIWRMAGGRFVLALDAVGSMSMSGRPLMVHDSAQTRSRRSMR